ncbi:hypothetical protein L1887_33804 [Cichorium endivia]|nr:hypothetical protein L1887_33804 [Cichorium endivia]
MAFSSSSCSFTSFLVILVLLWSGSLLYANGCYTSIISFGDSVSDTGNLKQLASIFHKYYPSLQPPYGETFFHQPTGRCSNGRLLIDFLAESLGLPLVPPFLHDKESGNVMEFRHGVNYAVAGSTALDPSFLEPRGIVNTMTNVSFGCQLAWFKQSLPYICTNVSDCRNFIEHSLFLVGKIGNNDYGYPIIAGKPIDEVELLVPLVTDTIISAVNELIDMGAKTLIVPGSVPLGCLANYLTVLGSINEEYDKTTGCLVKFNKFTIYHNEMLQMKLQHLRELYPNANIIYADYYNAAMSIIRSPLKFGFTNGALRACCGSGGPYNYNLSAECGMRSATESLCEDPDTYANWDGIHFTEAANRIISKSLFQGPYTRPRFDSFELDYTESTTDEGRFEEVADGVTTLPYAGSQLISIYDGIVSPSCPLELWSALTSNPGLRNRSLLLLAGEAYTLIKNY